MAFLPRRLTAAVAALTASALVLTGCSRGDGDTDTAASTGKERVVSLGYGDADTLLALDVTPVALATWGAEGDGDPSGVGPWAKDLLGDSTPTVIYNVANGFTADILEQVTAQNPDTIVAVNQAVDSEAKSSLEAIAPTTVKPEGYEDWQIPWDEQVTQIAGAVDKQKEGEQLIADTKAVFEKFKKDHPELQGKRVAIGMPYAGKFGLYTSGDGRGQFVENLGFVIPKELQGDGSQFFVDYSPENYADLNNVDYLFVLDYNGAVDELKKDATFQNLEIVKDGRVRYFHTDVGNAMSMPNPVTIPWAADKFAEQLA
ncbi:iron ABC transporter substrate-binding protein [Corynebacterium renale]|uniref:Iron complex transport system substrate-binding protein n=1 Tax=Corynebacterium renale TaxID=1724 RepID=A0A2A9DPH5_9CORY|nr:iron-siderophore ABC transporter substrate-binding protein [Corynebacterium renale]PFG28256.1 iron complex transport system substrate-binding protein [Corynebacterium renale]SQG65154.1 iron ABC transporter substrate-binding protein [Corynebacterium renale]SQI19534.1 iron ABC transporter substrate-binding protein [Corynebacterium renale]STC98097.1 iron ABC transporter substrate-binding protein [Corynebacterium renale]